jgi:MFS family permease
MSMNPTVPGASIFASLRGAATLAPFRYPIFRAIWLASLGSSLGSLTQSVGASWLMLQLAPSPDMVALVQAAVSLPILLFSLLSGAVADIWDRRRVMLAAQLAMLTVSLALAALAFVGAVTPWALLAFTFALGAGAALYGPAWQASVGEQVPRLEVPGAVALNSLAFNLARAVGPALGGAVVAVGGPQMAFLLNAISYTGLIVVLARWRPPPRESRLPPESMGPAVVAGLRYASQSPPVRIVLLRSLAFGLAGAGVWALLPLVAREHLGGGPLTYGLLLGAFGLGAIAGAVASASLRRRFEGETLVRGATLVFGLGSLVVAGSGTLPPLALALVAAGAAWVVALSGFNIAVQMSCPRWVMGRAMAVYQMTVFGGLAGGSWLWGAVAAQHGLALALNAAGLVMLAGLLLASRFRMPSYDKVNLDPSGSWPEPEVALDFDQRDGPIGVFVEYRIAEADAAGFVAAMRTLRRIRRRDGASRWALMQSISEPTRWFESFEVATWLEHLRQLQRTTLADQPAEARIRALHRGPEPPRVRHLLHRPVMSAKPPAAEARKVGAST